MLEEMTKLDIVFVSAMITAIAQVVTAFMVIVISFHIQKRL